MVSNRNLSFFQGFIFKRKLAVSFREGIWTFLIMKDNMLCVCLQQMQAWDLCIYKWFACRYWQAINSTVSTDLEDEKFACLFDKNGLHGLVTNIKFPPVGTKLDQVVWFWCVFWIKVLGIRNLPHRHWEWESMGSQHTVSSLHFRRWIFFRPPRKSSILTENEASERGTCHVSKLP